MAMRTASPWWLSVVFGLGLVCTLVGERLLSQVSGVHFFLSGILGVGLLLAVTAGRAWTTLATSGARRRVERTLLICHLGTLLALVLYALTTKWGLDLLHIKNTERFEGALTVLYGVLLLASIVPVLMIELSLGVAMRTGFDVGAEQTEGGVEYLRVREIGWSGLTIAFALALLMVTCQVSKERNVQRDVSYFKTSAAGESTRNIAASSSADPIKVHLFFPATNEVKEQVKSYFEALKSAAGNVEIADHDRFVDAELAGKYKVSKDGMIVLARGAGDKEKFFTIEVETEIEKARKGAGKLRNLDREVNSILMKLVREKRKAYVMTGHGEITNYDSVPPDLKGRVPERRTSVFKKRLADLNYEVKDLGLIELAKDVPDDATIVIMLGASVPLQPAEWDALGRYLDRGGRLMIALDPTGDPGLGSLEGKLGLKYNPGHLTDDREYLPQRGTLADRRFVITSQFSAHASTTALSRSVGKGLVLIDAGALEDVPFTTKGTPPTKTVTIRSSESSWLDLSGEEAANYTFDDKTEKRQRWNLGVALEGPKDGAKDGFRALVFSDADLFADALVQSQMGRASVVLVSGPLLDDAVRWLGGEEVFSGEVVSEDDKAVEHTKNQDAYWFATMIIGAPLLVLTLGLVGTRTRKRRSKKSEVTP
jgi:ABC-type uncharacterized transport system